MREHARIGEQCKCTVPKFMPSTAISEFVQFYPAGFDEVQRLISSLPSKQCGLDPIPTWPLKKLLHLLLLYLTHLFNKSLSSGQFPRSFKEAQVRPILKKSTLDPQLPLTNGPIPKRFVLSRLLIHLNNNALFPQDSVSISSAPLQRNCCPESCVWHQGGIGCWSRLPSFPSWHVCGVWHCGPWHPHCQIG